MVLLNAAMSLEAQQSGLDRWFVEACQNGNVEKASELLKQGVSPNATWKDGYTALHAAASQGGLKAVELLLAAGADPNMTTAEGETPLHSAVSGDRDLERVKALVKAGARLNVANKEGITPVRLAAINESKPIYDWLVEVGGGKEPRPAIDANSTQGRSTKELLAELSSINEEARMAAQRGLLARGDEVVPEALTFIEASGFDERYYKLLWTLGSKAALPVLEAQLGDKTRVFAAGITIDRIKPGTLASLDDKTKLKAAAALYEAIVDPNANVMAGFCFILLTRMEKSAVPTILRLLRHENPKYREMAAGNLAWAKFSDDQLQPELSKLAREDKDASVRAAAARALGNVGEPTPEVKEVLLSMLKNAPRLDAQNRDEAAVAAMREWGETANEAAGSLRRFGPEIIDDLLPLLTPLDAPTRGPAITALKNLGPAGVPRLIELCAHVDRSIATSASIALGSVGWGAVPQLAAAVRTGDDRTIQYVSGALAEMRRGAKEALPALFEVAGDRQRSAASRVAAAGAAIQIDRESSRMSAAVSSVIPALERRLESGSHREQLVAAQMAGALGAAAREMLPALRKRAETPEPDAEVNRLASVREEVKKAIAAIERGVAAEKQ